MSSHEDHSNDQCKPIVNQNFRDCGTCKPIKFAKILRNVTGLGGMKILTTYGCIYLRSCFQYEKWIWNRYLILPNPSFQLIGNSAIYPLHFKLVYKWSSRITLQPWSCQCLLLRKWTMIQVYKWVILHGNMDVGPTALQLFF